jgi:hypothetical protein
MVVARWLQCLQPSRGSGGRNKSQAKYSYRNRWKDFSIPVDGDNFDSELSVTSTIDDHCSKSSCSVNSSDSSCSSQSSVDIVNLESDGDSDSNSSDYDFKIDDDEDDCSYVDEFELEKDDTPVFDATNKNKKDRSDSSSSKNTCIGSDGGHVLLSYDDLTELLTKHLRCDCGARKAVINRTTVGISTELEYVCTVCNNNFVLSPEMTKKFNEETNHNEKTRMFVQVDSHALNNRLILLTQLLGASRKAANFIAGMLDLSTKYKGTRYRKAEDSVGIQEILLSEKIMIENQLKEIEGQEPDENGKYSVRVGGDAGWQQGQKKFNSPSGHAMLVGQVTLLVLALIVYSKLCSICDSATRMKKTPVAHECSKNYSGSSKGMEAKGILQMVTDLWNKTNLAVTTYVSDRDSSTRAVLSPVQTNEKKHKGLLPADHYPVEFFTDPNHIVRSFGSKCYKLSRMGKKKSEMSKSDAPRLKRNFSYWARRGNRGNIVIYRRQSRAVVEHHFNNHSYCTSDFCKLVGKPEEELVKLTKYRCKKINEKLYKQAMAALNLYTDEKSLKELMHNMHTQKNESMNRVAMRFAPKQFCFARSKALTYRLHVAVGINSIGHFRFYSRLFELLGIQMTDITAEVMMGVDALDGYQRERKTLLASKSKRAHQRNASMVKELEKEEEDRKKGMTYGPPKPKGEKKDGTKRKKGDGRGKATKMERVARTSCKHCDSLTHSRQSHRDCPYNPKNVAARNLSPEPEEQRKNGAEEGSSGDGQVKEAPREGTNVPALVTPMKRPGGDLDTQRQDDVVVGTKTTSSLLSCCQESKLCRRTGDGCTRTRLVLKSQNETLSVLEEIEHERTPTTATTGYERGVRSEEKSDTRK